MQWIYEAMQKHEIDVESQDLLEQGHKVILQSECYENYGCPSDIDKMKQEPVPLFLKCATTVSETSVTIVILRCLVVYKQILERYGFL